MLHPPKRKEGREKEGREKGEEKKGGAICNVFIKKKTKANTVICSDLMKLG